MGNQIQGGTIRKVELGAMHALSRHAQREKLNDSRVNYLVANMDLDKIGLPILSDRDGQFYIIDGQHRIEAMKRWLGDGWQAQKIECRVYSGLTEAQEAEIFLGQNDVLQVDAFDKFRVSVSAGRPDAVHIHNIVRGVGLCISKQEIDGSVRAVGTLQKLYRRTDPATLSRTLRIIRDAYGNAGFRALVIDGIGHLCQRYNGTLDEHEAVKKLSETHGGLNGLLNKAEVLHKQVGNQKSHCVAAAAVDIINSGRGGKKLPSWWQQEAA